MANILGIGGSIHDYASCLLSDEKMLAIEDERLTRVRYAVASKNPCQPSLNYCLKHSGIALQDLDVLIGNNDLQWLVDKKIASQCQWINHHLTHAYSAFFTSPFEQAAVLVIDGAGSKRYLENQNSEARETTTCFYGIKNTLRALHKTYGDLSGENPLTQSQTVMSNSLGELYRILAETLELGWLSGPGKAMGLSAYSALDQNNYFVEVIMECVELLPAGQFKIHANGKGGLIDKLFAIRQKDKASCVDEAQRFALDASIAAAGQFVFEKILFHLLKDLYTRTKTDNLCLAGGAALNSIANGKIAQHTDFKNIHVFYAPGDSGTAVGAALYAYVRRLKQEPIRQKVGIRIKLNPFLGAVYDEQTMLHELQRVNLAYQTPDNLYETVANLLAQGKIIAWYQKGSEFGPRALGHRSILADPRNPTVRDRINHHIKQREWFRPLAPVVLDRALADYFELPLSGSSPWMQFVWPVKEKFRTELPGITHVDGSARVQSVTRETVPEFYELIQTFYRRTGLPMLLNTSLNIKGQPIVETPQEAVQTFLGSSLDGLVLGNFIVYKHGSK